MNKSLSCTLILLILAIILGVMAVCSPLQYYGDNDSGVPSSTRYEAVSYGFFTVAVYSSADKPASYGTGSEDNWHYYNWDDSHVGRVLASSSAGNDCKTAAQHGAAWGIIGLITALVAVVIISISCCCGDSVSTRTKCLNSVGVGLVGFSVFALFIGPAVLAGQCDDLNHSAYLKKYGLAPNASMIMQLVAGFLGFFAFISYLCWFCKACKEQTPMANNVDVDLECPHQTTSPHVPPPPVPETTPPLVFTVISTNTGKAAQA
jgi:hypothetical protein